MRNGITFEPKTEKINDIKHLSVMALIDNTQIYNLFNEKLNNSNPTRFEILIPFNSVENAFKSDPENGTITIKYNVEITDLENNKKALYENVEYVLSGFNKTISKENYLTYLNSEAIKHITVYRNDTKVSGISLSELDTQYKANPNEFSFYINEDIEKQIIYPEFTK
ncbi:UNVERIFIED_CONTAM: hypothetical protein O8I53_10335 [Campylobacter lari]